MNEEVYEQWLYSVDGVGEKTIDVLKKTYGDAEAVYHAPEKELLHFLKEKQMAAFREAKRTRNPVCVYDALKKNRIRFLTRASKAYPKKLRDIPDPPFALYVKGELPDETKPSVAIVGARMCSEYGRYMARNFGAELARAGVQVISGMALGVDGVAQKAALQAGGKSFALLGSGVDVCYPPENRELYDLLCKQGGVVSEYALSTQPKRWLFPPRNRLIAGLADAVLVIEARAKSGTLITVDMALEQGKDVYAIPGRATDRLSDGCNALLKQGAYLATSAADIVERFYGVGVEKPRASSPTFKLTDTEKQLIDALDVHAKPASAVEETLQAKGVSIPPQEMLCALVDLALRGVIVQDGGFFALKLA